MMEHPYFPRLACLSAAVIAFGLGGCDGDSGQAENDANGDDEPIEELEPETFLVSTQIGAQGSIEPTQLEVEEGETASFVIQPELGFQVDSAEGCAGIQTDAGYETGPITEACTIEITFSRILAMPQGLQIEGLDEQIALRWEAVEGADLYRVYYSESPELLPGHGAVTELDTPGTAALLSDFDNGTTYYLAVEARSTDDYGSELSEEVSTVPFPTAYPSFNDTGSDRCNTATSATFSDCPLADYPDQDGDHGRDADARNDLLNKFGSGEAGFDFTKLDAQGHVLLDQDSTDFACVRDNATGLTWEVKTNDGGLHHADHTYTWYSEDATTNGGEAGTQNGGSCFGSACDTQAFADAVNENQFCGFNNWRLPTVGELQSIVHYGKATTPAIDLTYFPTTSDHEYWTSQTHAPNVANARVLDFERGNFPVTGHRQKNPGAVGEGFRVRLVRSPVLFID